MNWGNQNASDRGVEYGASAVLEAEKQMTVKSNAKPLVDPVSLPVYAVLCGITVLCVLLLTVRSMRIDHQPFLYLLWNLFLAWLPVIVSLLAVRFARYARGFFLALGTMIISRILQLVGCLYWRCLCWVDSACIWAG